MNEKYGESGQTTILVGLLLFFVLMPILGLVVEGGRMFATFRHLQSVADAVALVAAEDLPSNTAGASTDGCAYALSNGFSCLASTSHADIVLPNSLVKSPYSSISSYTSGYVEARITQTLGTIPIFNIPVTLSAHAVARNGIPSPKDYAITVLDPTAPKALDMSGSNGLFSIGPIQVNSTGSGTSIAWGGSGEDITCSSGWYNADNQPWPGSGGGTIATAGKGVQSNLNGSLQYAPPACVPAGPATGGVDTTAAYTANAGQIADPYGSSDGTTTGTVAPTASNMSTNCSECGNTMTEYLDRTTSPYTWKPIPNNGISPGASNKFELFPGVYTQSVGMNGQAWLYLNPGVYTFEGGFDVEGGNVCVFGAPVCDTIANTGTYIPGYETAKTTCGNASFLSTDATYITPTAWYYYCSPYGVWDSTYAATAPAGSGINAAAPTFIDNSVSPIAATTLQMNGVTIYMKCTTGCSNNKNQVKLVGGGGLSLAAPNACGGTGSGSAGSVAFPDGAIYNQQTSMLSSTPSTSTVYMYPNVNFLAAGETSCTLKATVWKGELGSVTKQHMHFLLFAQDNNQCYTPFSIGGGGSENWIGVLHDFPAYSQWPDPPTSSYSNCSVTIGGNAGASANGPPFLSGQIVSDTLSMSGSATVEVFYRPGGGSTGPGTFLVQ